MGPIRPQGRNDPWFQIDAFNRNVAARLAKILIVWRRHDAPRGLAMRGTLEWIRDHELSPNTGEVVDKGLA